jgi:negative regulator of flagellin synthesis FlgM
MIDKIGNSVQAGIAQARLQGAGRSVSVAAAQAGQAGAAQAPASPAAALAAEGAPVDTDKVARIRAAIAAGSYKVDPHAIADKMIALDLPGEAE